VPMKRILVLLLVVVFVVAACVAPAEQPVAEPTPEPAPQEVKEKVTKVQEKPTEEAPDEDTKEEVKEAAPAEPSVIIKSKEETVDVPTAPSPEAAPVPTKNMDEDIAALLNKADQKIKSYKFLLAAPPENLARDWWLLKGTRIKIELFDENWLNNEEYFDTIFLDTAKKTAVGACISRKTVRCASSDKEFDVDYEEAVITTPYQWVKKIPLEVEKVSTEMLWDRKVTVLRYMDGDTEIKQWVDNFAGLPVKVQITAPGKEDRPTTWQFRDLSVNSVGDKEVIQ